VLYHQGKLEEAEKTFREVLAERERMLGADNPDVLTTRNNFAAVLNERGQVAAAEAHLMADVLAASEQILGPRHPDTLVTEVSLAAIRANQGRVAETLPLLEDAIEGLPGHLRLRPPRGQVSHRPPRTLRRQALTGLQPSPVTSLAAPGINHVPWSHSAAAVASSGETCAGPEGSHQRRCVRGHR
jgi:hypothetical protein